MLFDYSRLQKEQKEKIINKWKPFLKGVNDDYIKEGTAMLLENEAQYLLEEPSTTASDVTGIQKIMLPIVRRVFPNLLAHQIVSVQPLAAPTGVIFWLKYEFATAKSGTLAGDEYSMYSDAPSDTSQGYNPYYSSDDVKTTATGAFNTFAGADNPIFYFTTIAAYRDGLGTADAAATSLAILYRVWFKFKALDTSTTANSSYFLVRYNPSLSGWQIKEYDRTGVGVPLWGNATTAVFGAMVEATYMESTGKLKAATCTYYGATAGGAGSTQYDIDFNFTSANGTQGTDVTLSAVESHYAYKQEGSTAIPDMSISIAQYPISVKSRKLKATWTNEAEQDLKAYHGLNADAELTALVSNEMIAEIDREVVGRCMDVVPISSFRFVDWEADVANNTSGNFLDRNIMLAQVIAELSNEIYRKSKIGPANWVVTSPKVCSYLETLDGFITAPGATMGGLGIVKVGNYKGNFTLYKDPLFPADKLLLGHKSPQSPFGAGIVYSPYVTQITPTLYGPDDFTPRKGFIARYGLTEVPLGNLLYAMISVTSLPGAV